MIRDPRSGGVAPDEKVCAGNGAVCASAADCPAGQVCLEGLCWGNGAACQSDADCPSGQVCKNQDVFLVTVKDPAGGELTPEILDNFVCLQETGDCCEPGRVGSAGGCVAEGR